MPAPAVVRVVRAARTVTYHWDRPPTGRDRARAERADPPGGKLVGHSWPGFDDGLASNAYIALNLGNQAPW